MDPEILICSVALLPNAYENLPYDVQVLLGEPKMKLMEHAIQTSLHESKIRWPGEDVGLVFDSLDRDTARLAHALRQVYLDKPKWHHWTSFTDASSYKLTMLQAADLIAYGTYRFHSESGPPDFRVAPHMERIVKKANTIGQIWNTESLLKIYQRGAAQ